MSKIKKTKYEDRIEYRNSDFKLHNPNGPAVIWNDGSKAYYINGKLHRLDGPAYITSYGSEWHINNYLFGGNKNDFYSNFKQIIDLENQDQDFKVEKPKNKVKEKILNIKKCITENLNTNLVNLLKLLM